MTAAAAIPSFDSLVKLLVVSGFSRAVAEREVRKQYPSIVSSESHSECEAPKPTTNKPRMNGIETRRSIELEALRRAGEIRSWQFEALKFVLADRTTYTPDFLVELNDQSVRIEEVKGHWRDDARVKIKVAARLFPMFHFVALTPRRIRDGGGWNHEAFRA